MLQSALRHAEQEARIATLVESLVARLWTQVSSGGVLRLRRGRAVVSSWTAVAPSVLAAVRAGQISAATPAEAYLESVLAEQGVSVDPDAQVVPASFSGYAADGRPLSTLLDQSVTGRDGVLDRIGQGQPPAEALRSGGLRLRLLAVATVQDAGRAAVGAGIAARSGVGYVRVLTPPSCSRCVILAGRFYRWNAGFSRHPRCDCRHVPAPEANAHDLVTDPEAYVRSLSEADQNALLTKAGAQAVRDGADLNRVVNARRGLSESGLTTTELVGRGVRLTPEAIYKVSATREEALQRLKAAGYLR